MINAPTYSLPAGTIIDKRYEIVRYISSGGFGITYEAIDKRFNSKVAVKELYLRDICNRDSNTDSISVNDTNISTFGSHKRKFLKEAHRLHKLSHPNIVKVSDVIDANGTAYYVMDYIEGNPLSKERTPMDEGKVRNIINQVLDAIEYIHNKKLLHLDIKPANIMIDSNGCAILIDFGASKIIEKNEIGDSSTASATSILAYTPGYAPLEQTSASSLDNLGPHTDIYALGATIYKLITGNNPPMPNDIITNNGKIPGINNISPNIRKVIEKTMTLDYTSRTSSAAQLRNSLNFIPKFNNKTLKRLLIILSSLVIISVGFWCVKFIIGPNDEPTVQSKDPHVYQDSLFYKGDSIDALTADVDSTAPEYIKRLSPQERADVVYLKKNNIWNKDDLKSTRFIAIFNNLKNGNIEAIAAIFNGYDDKYVNFHLKNIIAKYQSASVDQKNKFKNAISDETIDIVSAYTALSKFGTNDTQNKKESKRQKEPKKKNNTENKSTTKSSKTPEPSNPKAPEPPKPKTPEPPKPESTPDASFSR